MMTVLIGVGAVLLCLISVYLLVLVRPGHRKSGTDDGRLFCHYAHRGLHGGEIPENSLAAFRKAAEEGYGMELDIQLSADGEVMVFHDDTLDRMTERKGRLSDYTAAELSAVRLKTGEGVLTDETVPTLRQVLETVDGAVPLLIELKGESTDTSLCPAADRILREYSGPYCVESFNPMLLFWYRKHRGDVLRGQLYTDVYREKGKNPLNLLLSLMALNVLSRPHFAAYDRKYRKKLPVRIAVGLFGAVPFVWTVRSEPERGTDGEYMIFENIRP